METQPQKTVTSPHGAMIVRRSDRCSNIAVKTGTVVVRDTGDPDRNTLQIADLTKLFPPFHTEKEIRKDNLLIPLSKVSVFAKHYNANVMYYTLFGLPNEIDSIDLKVSCISRTELPMTDFAVGLVPSAYRHTKQPFVSIPPAPSFLRCLTPLFSRLPRAPEAYSCPRLDSSSALTRARFP